MTRSVVYSPRARQQLTDLYLWISEQSGFPDRASDYISAMFDYCDGLTQYPMVGLARDDLRPGLRTISFRRRAVALYRKLDVANCREALAVAGEWHLLDS